MFWNTAQAEAAQQNRRAVLYAGNGSVRVGHALVHRLSSNHKSTAGMPRKFTANEENLRNVRLAEAAAANSRRHYEASLLRRLTPVRAADFSRRMRSATAAAATSGVAAFSISAISAEPTTAASAIPPSTVTCVGSEMPKPTATGSVVNFRARRISAGNCAGSSARSPVTPAREIT